MNTRVLYRIAFVLLLVVTLIGGGLYAYERHLLVVNPHERETAPAESAYQEVEFESGELFGKLRTEQTKDLKPQLDRAYDELLKQGDPQ